MNAHAADWTYLRAYLAPLRRQLERSDVTDLYINQPGELWVETLDGTTERYERPELSEELLARLVSQIAAYSSQGLNRAHPLLSAALPDGSRVQVAIAPAATRVTIAVRKHLPANLSLADYASQGAFDKAATGASVDRAAIDRLREYLARQDLVAGLRFAVRSRLNVLISGGTSTGKTTFLNALIAEIPDEERLISIEDTPELRINQPNAVALLAVRGALGEAQVTTDDLVTASLRMRPDRILLGELRGPEAYAFLRAVNTGHPGSMSTIHANSAAGAIDQLALLVLQAGSRLSRPEIRDYVRGTVDLYVQLARTGGRRYVAEIVLSNDVL